MQYGALFIGSGGETDGCSVQLKGDWSDSYLEKLPSHTPIDLLLIEQNGWSPSTDLSYLKSIPNLRSLAIVARSNINNLPPIPSLQSLAVSYKDYSPIDLSQYPSLSACSLFWSSKISGLFSCTQLRKLTLLKFAFHDLKKLAALKNLETLSIVDCRLSSLSGIESLKSLKILELAYLPKLERLDELTHCPKLEKRAGPQILGHLLRWNLLPQNRKIRIKRKADDETDKKEIFSRLQSEGSVGGHS